MSRKIIRRFWDKVQKTKSCWIWKAGTNGCGYGRFRVGEKKLGAHRFSWELCKGTISKKLLLLHKCNNPKCVKPQHLYLGTHKDNSKDRKMYARKCRNGHKYTKETTRIREKTNSRECRICIKNWRKKQELKYA